MLPLSLVFRGGAVHFSFFLAVCELPGLFLFLGFWVSPLVINSYLSKKKILQLRERIRPLIKHKVGDGAATFLWHDS